MNPVARKSNYLIREKSPYLLQHAHNPVNWHPWGEEAFQKARTGDKPIFLSIGYSTCHWCHVMERESFEDEEVAALLNAHFVSIKVDREERPDVDSLYMTACQAVTGHGGWPLTIVMTPDQKPFFAGTYFPKHGTGRQPGLIEILDRITYLWANEKDRVLASGNGIAEAIRNSCLTQTKGDLSEEVLHRAFRYYQRAYDSESGGFGPAPKFPAPHNLLFLLRYWQMTGRTEALQMVEKTLDSMYLGGIYDHVGAGFARYSTDRRWLVPHFEKMLYDNALLALAYLEAWQATAKNKYAETAKGIFSYILREMTSPEGAFYSAEDADSEGEEGKFYLWTPKEIREVLGDEEGSRFCRDYDITPEGNFAGKSIPNLIATGYVQGYQEALAKLFRKREQRVHPFKDDKILTAWNGLMIAALALGSRVLDEPRYKIAAEGAASFIGQNLRRSDGRLLARYRDGEAAYPGYVDDYAFLIWGLLELYQAAGQSDYLTAALELNQDLLKYFWDQEEGGLFQSGSDAENLIARPKEILDGALPSGNSVAALNFLRLARLTGDPGLEETAQAQLRAFGGSIEETPEAFSYFLTAVSFNLRPTVAVTIVGDSQAEDTREMIKTVNSRFGPEILLTVKQRPAVEGKATAFVCKGFSCRQPTTDLDQLAQMLQ